MKFAQPVLLILLLMTMVHCKQAKKESEEAATEPELEEVTEEVEIIKFKMEAKSDSGVEGEATFTEQDRQVTLEASFTGLTPGEHAIHIHEKADCSAADGTSTGGHWNPTSEPHGKWGAAEGFHKGDIGNFEADADGNGSITFSTDQWCIGCDDPNKDLIGKAVIVHQGVDDFVSQPTGAAGGRVSCTGIIQ